MAYRGPVGTLLSFNYEYDAVGNPLKRVEEDGAVQTYEYDRLYRLTKVTYPEEKIRRLQGTALTPPGQNPGSDKSANGKDKPSANQGQGQGNLPVVSPVIPDLNLPQVYGSVSYTYDQVGNRLSQTRDGVASSYSYDSADQLLRSGEEGFTYDENGNTILKQTPEGAVEYRYDGDNRLIETRFADGTWVKYSYDGFGRRVYREEAYWQNKNLLKTEITSYLWDGLHVLMEFDGKGASPLAEYYLANGQILAKKIFGFHGRKEPGNDDLIRTRGGLLYYHYDRLGTVMALTDRQGQMADRYYYDVFGQPLAGTFGPYNSYGLTGKEYDKKLEQYYFGARWLNSVIGRWLTVDAYRGSIAQPLSLQRYSYVLNNPLRYFDFFGFADNEAMRGLDSLEYIELRSVSYFGSGLIADDGVLGGRLFYYQVDTTITVTKDSETKTTNVTVEAEVSSAALSSESTVYLSGYVSSNTGVVKSLGFTTASPNETAYLSTSFSAVQGSPSTLTLRTSLDYQEIGGYGPNFITGTGINNGGIFLDMQLGNVPITYNFDTDTQGGCQGGI